MCGATINTVGLFLDIVGVVILFFNGPPVYPVLPDGREFIWSDSDAKGTKAARRKLRWSKIGLGLLGVGFVFQLCSNYVGE